VCAKKPGKGREIGIAPGLERTFPESEKKENLLGTENLANQKWNSRYPIVSKLNLGGVIKKAFKSTWNDWAKSIPESHL